MPAPISTGIVAEISGDFLEIVTLSDVSALLLWNYEDVAEDGTVTPKDLTGYAIELDIFAGTPDRPGDTVLTFTQTPQAHGQIDIDLDAATATLSFAAMNAAAFPLGSYGFRERDMIAGVCVKRRFYGRWRHKPR